MPCVLEVNGIDVFHGHLHALKGVSLKVDEGEVVSLLGANGAGKTTLLSAISRLMPFTSGRISLFGEDIARMLPPQVVRLGVSHCPEGRGIFPEMSVEENLLIGANVKSPARDIASLLERQTQRFPILKERLKQPGGTLSGGEQQMLALARALMSSPKLLMLDEPSLGLAPKMIALIFQTITELNKEGVSILLVEQNANEALLHSQRAYVLESGRISMEGTSKDLHKNPRIIDAYLG